MSFEHDVFISYPHLSNRDDRLGYNGWVAKFHLDLKLRLSNLLGRDALIWRDNKLPAGARFDEAIRNRLRQSRVLVCVVSPAYVRSEWCLKELEEFCRVAPQTGGLVVGEQSRVIAAVKTPTRHEVQEFERSLYLPFYEVSDDMNGLPREFSQTAGGYRHDQYELRMDQIAWSIFQIIEGLGGDDEAAAVNKTIYLAETTRYLKNAQDQNDWRGQIRNELEARGYTVVPAEPLSKETAQEYTEAVGAQLARSFMSIHLMGRTYGLIPDAGEGKSFVHIQNDLAAARSARDESFKRLIWIPNDLADVDPRQAAFLDALRNSEEALAGAELLERPFEDMKTRLVHKLTAPKYTPPPDNLLRVYLMCDKEDAAALSPVESYLFDKGYEVIPPAEEGDEGQVIQYHKNNLLLCDATLILYGHASRNFVRLCLDEVTIKAKGLGRVGGIPCRAVLRTAPPNDNKTTFRTNIASVLEPPCYGDLSAQALEESLRNFISCLESSSGGGGRQQAP